MSVSLGGSTAGSLAVSAAGATPTLTTPGSGLSAEGPGGVASPGDVTIGAGAGGTGTDGGLESSMAQSQALNLYYLQVQEEVNAQNRTFTALSNVLEVEHNTAKSAIGNIH
jgi:hypothetical protein